MIHSSSHLLRSLYSCICVDLFLVSASFLSSSVWDHVVIMLLSCCYHVIIMLLVLSSHTHGSLNLHRNKIILLTLLFISTPPECFHVIIIILITNPELTLLSDSQSKIKEQQQRHWSLSSVIKSLLHSHFSFHVRVFAHFLFSPPQFDMSLPPCAGSCVCSWTLLDSAVFTEVLSVTVVE